MRAALRIFAIGAIMVNIGAHGPLNSGAHIPVATAAGAATGLDRQAGIVVDATGRQTHSRALITNAPAAPACQATNLAITQDMNSGATGHIAIELRLHNASRQPCTLKGYATIVLLDGARRPLLTVLRWGPGGFFNFNRPVRLVTLAPGGNAYVALGWAHIPQPGQTCPPAPNLLFLPPAASSALLVAVGHGDMHAYGVVDACGGQLSVSAVEPTPFML